MKVVFRRSFKKQYKKLPKTIQIKFADRLSILVEDDLNPLLKVHTLKGDKYPLESMNVTGDYRALFIRTKNTIIFYEIGTHSELYE